MSEVNELAAELGRAGPKADRVSTRSMVQVAEQLRADIHADTPVLTGATKASVNMKASANEARVTVGGASFWLEFGTSKMAPQPFMFNKVPAAQSRLAKLLAGINPFDR